MAELLVLFVLIVAVGTALGLIAGGHLLYWLIAALALAFLVGCWPPAWWPLWRRDHPGPRPPPASSR